MASVSSIKQQEWSACRYCSSEGYFKDISNTYFWEGTEEVYCKMLSTTFYVNIVCPEIIIKGISHVICDLCISKLREASEFKAKVQKAEESLQKFLMKPPKKEKIETISPKEELHDFVVDLDDVGLDYEDEELAYEKIAIESEENDSEANDSILTALEDKKVKVVLALENPLQQVTRGKKSKQELKTSKARKRELDDPEWDVKMLKKRKCTDKVKLKESCAKKQNKINDVPSTDVLETEQTAEEKKPRRVTHKSKSKEHQEKKAKTSNKRRTENSNIELLEDEKPSAVKINAKTILKYTTAYPFKLYAPGERKTFRCAYCQDKFVHSEPFHKHVDIVHKNMDKTVIIQSPHLLGLSKVDISKLSCRLCHKTFTSLENIAAHLHSDHSLPINLNESLGLIPMRLDLDDFKCDVCDETFTSLYRLSVHTTEHFALNVCSTCGKKVNKRYKSENCALHSTESYLCGVCKQTFPTLDARKMHYIQNKECLLYKCKECGERFSSPELRGHHYEKVHGIASKTFACPECDEVFPYRQACVRHYNMTHSDLYKCKYCDRRLWNNITLQSHIARVHTLEKKYRCTVCDNRYFDHSELKYHMNSHKESLQFPCIVCGAQFIKRFRLKNHILKRHPEVEVDIKKLCTNREMEFQV